MREDILREIDELQRKKYLLLKESQQLLHAVVCHQIQGRTHQPEAQQMMTRLMAMDASVEMLESSVDNAKDCLDEMTMEEVEDMNRGDHALYKEVFGKLH